MEGWVRVKEERQQKTSCFESTLYCPGKPNRAEILLSQYH